VIDPGLLCLFFYIPLFHQPQMDKAASEPQFSFPFFWQQSVQLFFRAKTALGLLRCFMVSFILLSLMTS